MSQNVNRHTNNNNNSAAIEAQLKELEQPVVSKVIEGKFTGAGIKRTPAYETNLLETEFNEAREKFWSTHAN
jgi:hypothetical protein